MWILIVGITMACASAIFWCMEFMPFIVAVRAIPNHTLGDKVTYGLKFIGSILKLWKLVIDIFCTVWLTSAFGFTGMIGGVIGITISNVISIFLLGIKI